MKLELIHHPDLQSIFGILRNSNFVIRLVGGAVRDAILERTITDFDFAAACSFAELEQFIQHSACKIVRKSPQHGSILFTHQSKSYDITILRQDKETDGRHAKILATDSWRIDAERRDFTINALSMCIDTGEVYDPLNQGIQDLRAQKLRFIGDTALRIREDYLRILRFFCFQAQLQYTYIENDLAIIQKEAAGLQRLSRQRIRSEVQKILHKPQRKILEQMQHCGLWSWVFSLPLPSNFGHLHTFQHPETDWILCLAAWFRDTALATEVIETLSRDLVFSKAEAQRFRICITQPVQPFAVATWLYKYGRKQSIDYWWLYIGQGQCPKALSTDPIPEFPIKAKDLMALGYSGAKIGTAMKKAEHYWLDSGLKAEQDSILSQMK